MKVLLYGRHGSYPQEIENLVKSFGLEIVRKNPEVVITFGGDGTFLGAERDWPEVPKLYLRDSGTCFHCSPLPNEELLKLFVNHKLPTQEFLKLEATVNGKAVTALNDVVIAHQTPNGAIRFTVDNEPELIGDGVVIATPFGSTAYFYSITKTTFTKGIGLAFNNVHNLKIREKILAENAQISVAITRGPAVLSADNNPQLISLETGDKVTVKKAADTAKILTSATFAPSEGQWLS
ncbi:MAG: hypothetical protein M1484_02155 [Patescibacteria group bacterium]|nr:hypothetical protein [Patescibacteria group bacterium]MCL5431884.1 hypothetical protein [Patescibacteria group bacterium]